MDGTTTQLAKNLATFDDLDFRVYSGQKWEDLPESHAEDIIVHWPDGHTTQGLRRHIEDLSQQFVFAPDTHIKEHPIRFGSAEGEWTTVIGFMEGTFTEPLVAGETTYQPTGKAFRLPMVTIGHWNADGVMDEEYLFWDNAAFMAQIGLA